MSAAPSDAPLLDVRRLSVRFPVLGGVMRRKVAEVSAVQNLSFKLHRGETLGLVGESGCGKSTTAKAICNILRQVSPGVEIDGEIRFYTDEDNWVDLLSLSQSRMRPYRAEVQMIFQDPFSSLNPRMLVSQIIGRPLKMHRRDLKPKDRRVVIEKLLSDVGLRPEHIDRYPHEFSGGQRQRLGIARALAVQPKLIIADEPVSALDVSVQSQVINLMQDLQEEYGLTYLFVAHDLSVVYHISDRIAVMYLGNLVEIGDAETVYNSAQHPYTQTLLSAVPQPIPKRERERIVLTGEIPSPLNRPPGCAFHPRCSVAQSDEGRLGECSRFVPDLKKKSTGQRAACFFTDGNMTPGMPK